MNHTDIINHVIKKHNLQSYLEIGVFNRDHNFNKIECPMKLCVDPDPNAGADFMMTSDRFFSMVHNLYDLVFIDGLHHSDQIKKDFENAARRLTDGGFIILHDTNPHSERITHVPRDNGEWTGDVYKFALTLHLYHGFNYKTFMEDYGVTVVKCGPSIAGHDNPPKYDWEFFNANRHLLNPATEEEIIEWI